MSYSESTGKLTLYSSDRDALDNLTSAIRSNLDKKGAQYNGPINPPPISDHEVHQFLRHLNNPDAKGTPNKKDIKQILFEIAGSDEDIKQLVVTVQNESPIFVRIFKIVGEESIRSAFSFEKPENVFVAATLGKKTHSKGRGYDPYSWDPNIDHIP
jgi:ribosomal protein S10